MGHAPLLNLKWYTQRQSFWKFIRDSWCLFVFKACDKALWACNGKCPFYYRFIYLFATERHGWFGGRSGGSRFGDGTGPKKPTNLFLKAHVRQWCRKLQIHLGMEGKRCDLFIFVYFFFFKSLCLNLNEFGNRHATCDGVGSKLCQRKRETQIIISRMAQEQWTFYLPPIQNSMHLCLACTACCCIYVFVYVCV